MSDLKKKLRGVVGFPITPLRADLSLDLEGLEKNVAGMIEHDFCAMVAAGGTGEIYSLTVEEAVAVVERTVRTVNGKVPVIGGVGYSTPLATDMARRMEKAGADALLVMPPYYINAPADGLVEYYKAIGASCGIPLAIYSRDWAAYSPEMVARLADNVPTLEVWKDGQGDARKYQRIMSYVGDRLAWVGGLGDDCVPAYFAVGVQAYTSSISNIAPKLSLALAQAGLAHDFRCLDSLMHKYVQPLYAIRERLKGYEVSVMKYAMELLGMAAGPVRPPLTNVRPQDTEDIRKLMDVYRDML